MGNDNITRIDGGEYHGSNDEPNEHIVDLCKMLTDLAESGQAQGMIVLVSDPEYYCQEFIVGNVMMHPFMAIGSLRLVEHMLLEPFKGAMYPMEEGD